MPRLSLLFLLLVVLPVGPGLAAHITDKLVVGLYAEPRAEGTPLELLSSGTPLEVLQRRDGFAEVRLANNGTGWVEATYVTEEKPAKAILLETQAKLRQMGLELAKLRSASGTDGGRGSATESTGDADLEAARARITELEAALAAAKANDLSEQRLAVVNDEVRLAIDRLAATQGLTLVASAQPVDDGQLAGYLPWVAALFALAAGFAGGVAFIDYRIRRRYGGFRL